VGSALSALIFALISALIAGVILFMAKKTRISAREYKPLRDAFYNAKYSSSGVLARLLLEAFLYEDGDVNSDWFVREKACTKGSFTKIRDRLVKDNWLHFREDSKKYFPGVRLRPHLDTVKASKAVTFSDLERKANKSDIEDLEARKADKSTVDEIKNSKADRSELQDLKVRMNEIAEAVQILQKASIPPDDEEKKKARKNATDRLGNLTAVN
jgi:hypothetical protein